jgi:pyruvate formate lyase activating enzyme
MDKAGILWKELSGKKVECTACARRCRLPDGARGFCYVRHNVNGKLHLETYGMAEAVQIDPIEKKPFNHFMPGSYVLGIGTSSCNWGCQFCQNHNISRDKDMKGIEMSPEKAVELALQNGVQGIAYTYNEPTIFIEYALDIAKIAHEKGLVNLFVTNGYMTPETIKQMMGLIDAAVVNFKGNGEVKFSNRYEIVSSVEPVKESLIGLKKSGIHVEITDLIVPTVGDSLAACDELTKWIYENLGSETPLQFTRFHPDYKMLDSIPTPYETLISHHKIARGNGLEYVYIGNLPGNEYENTYCPSCGSTVLKRSGNYLTGYYFDKNSSCLRCGHKIPILGKLPKVLRHEGIKSIY